MLEIKGSEYPSPEVQRVVSLKNILSPIGKRTVSEKESFSSQLQILTMIIREAISRKRDTDFVLFASPAVSFQIKSQLHGVIDFRVGERFVVAFIPTVSAKESYLLRSLLLEVDAKAVLDLRLR